MMKPNAGMNMGVQGVYPVQGGHGLLQKDGQLSSMQNQVYMYPGMPQGMPQGMQQGMQQGMPQMMNSMMGSMMMQGMPQGGQQYPIMGQMGSMQPHQPMPQGAAELSDAEKEKIYQMVLELPNPLTREATLSELSKKRESYPDLAPILWHSVGTISILIQETVSIYPSLNPPVLTAPASSRVCNALALLQSVSSHPETRQLFLNAHIPLFLYPFLNTMSKTKPFEYLRLTSLGVIGALVKVDDSEVIQFLLKTEIIPLCLRIMDIGSELSKTVATFIVQKILLDEQGLNYVCANYERFSVVTNVLRTMVDQLALQPSARLLKHIIRCYLRLTENPRAKEALKTYLPSSLRDNTFIPLFQDDTNTRRWLIALSSSVADTPIQYVYQ